MIRPLVLVLPVLALLVAAPAASAATATITMKEVKGVPKFVGPKTVAQGDTLKVVNNSNIKKVGPHTLSLVTQESLPKTPGARKGCFTPKGICLAIAKWHGLNKKEEITINPVKAGKPGWDTEGTTSKKGDSWFSEKRGETFSQVVSTDASAGAKDLYFTCAVHSFMQGQIEVVPPAAATTPPSAY